MSVLTEAVSFVVAALGGRVLPDALAARLDSRLTGRGDVAAFLAGNQRFAAFRGPVAVDEVRVRGEWAARALVTTGDDRWELDVVVSPEPPHRILSFQPRPVAGDAVEFSPVREADHHWSALGSTATESISRRLAAVAGEQKIVGLAAGIAVRGEVVYRGFFGVADLQTGAPLRASSVFRAGSVTKMVTALAVLKSLPLSAPLEGLEPGGPVGGPVDDSVGGPVGDSVDDSVGGPAPTVGQVLVHTGGLPKDMRPPFRVAWTPGERAEYSNAGFGLLGRMVARAAGTTFAQYCATEILAPYGLRHTTMQERGVAAPADVTGYRVADGRVAPAPPAVAALPGAGGMTADLDDLLTLTGLFSRGDDPLVRAALAHTAPAGPGVRFAPGFAILDDALLWRGGATDGFTAEIVAALDGSCDVVLLASKSPPEGLREVARALVEEADNGWGVS